MISSTYTSKQKHIQTHPNTSKQRPKLTILTLEVCRAFDWLVPALVGPFCLTALAAADASAAYKKKTEHRNKLLDKSAKKYN